MRGGTARQDIGLKLTYELIFLKKSEKSRKYEIYGALAHVFIRLFAIY
jgi:hypothetical protein